MNMLNQCIIEGNVAEEKELVTLPNEMKVYEFPIATSRFYKNAEGEMVEDVSFFEISTYGVIAEVCKKNATKGRGIRIVGRMKQTVWTDSDGKKHSKISIVAEHCDFKPLTK